MTLSKMKSSKGSRKAKTPVTESSNNPNDWARPSAGSCGVAVWIKPPNGEEQLFVYCSKCGYQDPATSEYVHVTKECKSATNAKANGTKFTSSNARCNQVVRAAKNSKSQNNDNVLDEGTTEAVAGAAERSGPRRKCPVDRPSNKQVAPKVTTLKIPVEDIDGNTAKVGYGRHSNMTYNEIVRKQPAIVNFYANLVVQDKTKHESNCYETFVEWLVLHGHVTERASDYEVKNANATKSAKKKKKKKAVASRAVQGKAPGQKTIKPAKKKRKTSKKEAALAEGALVDLTNVMKKSSKRTRLYSSDEDDGFESSDDKDSYQGQRKQQNYSDDSDSSSDDEY